jgi:hypothetical protein
MSVLRSFAQDVRGSTVDNIALFCAIVAVLSVVGAHGLDMLAKNGDLPRIAFTRAGHSDIDYSATGSIPDRAERTQIDPCGRNGGGR